MLLPVLFVLNHNTKTRINNFQQALHNKTGGLQFTADNASMQVMKGRRTLADSYNATVDTYSKLASDVKNIENELGKLQEKFASLIINEKELRKQFLSISLVQHTNGADAALGARKQRLKKIKDRLVKEYKMLYSAKQSLFEKKLNQSAPLALSRFYTSNQDTPFGPASGYHTAEKFYAKKRTTEAKRLYKEIIRKYPGSPYVSASKRRITEIQGRHPFSDGKVIEFTPYKSLIFTEDQNYE